MYRIYRKSYSDNGIREIGMRKKCIGKGIGILFIVVVAIMAFFVLTKRIKINPWIASGYPVHGVDVSHYQGEIDWEKLQTQGIRFAFIKATEGSTHVDEYFERNWAAACNTTLYVGAYHFFSFDSEGKTQAENYISKVGDLSGRLIPVVDIEYYGEKEANPPQKEQVIQQLRSMLSSLENEYHVKPMIYTTYKVYDGYIKKEFEEYPLWIRNVYYSPNMDKKNKWAFWQYSDNALLEGYHGGEKFIDMNVFSGDETDIKEYLVP